MKFVIKTDQKSLKHLMEQREIGADYQKGVSKIMGFNFDVVYKTGASNRVADALSREFASTMELGTLTTTCGVTWQSLQTQIKDDPFIKGITDDLAANKPVPKGYTLHHGTLKYKGRLVVPKNSALIPILLQEYHDSPLGGHSGDFRTY